MGERLHLRLSLALAAAFLALGLGLEAMIGLRDPAFFEDATRRELLRLGHAHGGVLALLNLGLSWALARLCPPDAWAQKIRVAALLGAVLVGAGFLGGGLWHGPTDPGPLVLLVPAGALLLLCALAAALLLRAED
jgi:hypothetical protein